MGSNKQAKGKMRENHGNAHHLQKSVNHAALDYYRS
jgi:hypothetical protein